MKHNFIDKYAELASPIHRVNAKIKFLAALVFVVVVSLLRYDSFIPYGIFLFGIATVIIMSKLPIIFIFKRSLVIVPFVLAVSIFLPFMRSDGTKIFINIAIKSYLSILCLITLTSTTKFSDLINAMNSLKTPRIFTLIISFMYRYIFVVHDEFLKMKMAKESRSVGRARWLSVKALANMVGVLFIRSYERGEAVYLAMCARGFDG